mgnify:CR=1 FL=1
MYRLRRSARGDVVDHPELRAQIVDAVAAALTRCRPLLPVLAQSHNTDEARLQAAGILADEMGLGKTVQTLAHILTEKTDGRLTTPALVVCPTSLVANWRHEAERYHVAHRFRPQCGHTGSPPGPSLLTRTVMSSHRWLPAAQIGLLFALFVAWHVLTRTDVLPPFFFGEPLVVLARIRDWFSTGEILPHLGITLLETLLAFVIGTVSGLGVGLWLGLSDFAARLLDPYIKAFNAITVGAMGDPRALSGGISEALITTAAGLVVAIPSLIAYRYLRGRVERIVIEMEKSAISLADAVEAAAQRPAADDAGTESA